MAMSELLLNRQLLYMYNMYSMAFEIRTTFAILLSRYIPELTAVWNDMAYRTSI